MPRKPQTGDRSTIANVLAVSPSTITNWVREADWPDGDGEWSIQECVLWWVLRKARKSVRQKFHAELGESLGIEPCDEPAVFDAKAERDSLDLRLKEAELERKLGGLVRVADIEAGLQRFAAGIRDALEAVEKTSGQPVLPIVEPVFESVLDELKKAGDRR